MSLIPVSDHPTRLAGLEGVQARGGRLVNALPLDTLDPPVMG